MNQIKSPKAVKDRSEPPESANEAALSETAKLLCGIGKASIGTEEITISDYPFEPACVFPDRLLLPGEINAIALDAYPPQLRIGQEVIFIGRQHHQELKAFAVRHGIATVAQTWNWDWLLEPYLDTEFTPKTDTELRQKLLKHGIDKAEVDAIREEVGPQMYKYNFETMLWEWGSLSLSDVLAAMRAKYNRNTFREFYHRAMEIELRTGSVKLL